jgi:esterase/lipase superfamily enzyme
MSGHDGKQILGTRRAVAELHVSVHLSGRGVGFRKRDYARLREELERFDRERTVAEIDVYAIDEKRRFGLRRDAGGPVLLFEKHLLTDPLFSAVASRLLRTAIAIAGDGARNGVVAVTLRAGKTSRILWMSGLTVDAMELSRLTLEVPVVRLRMPERRELTESFPRTGGSSTSLFFAKTTRFSVTHSLPSFRDVVSVTPPEPEPPRLVSVFYATERARSGDKRPSHYYGYKPDNELHLGMVRVSMPANRPIGQVVVAPSIFKIRLQPNPGKHMFLSSVTEIPAAEYFERMRRIMEANGGKRAFVFVHGFNVTFEDAALRTAQIHQDLGFEGAPIFYSWPSKGKASVTAYKYDEAKVGSTHWALEEFLRAVWTNTGAEEIHVIAHSMGNRAVAAALDRIMAGASAKLPFQQIVFAAPDLDADHFQKLAAKIGGAGRRLTLYGSSKDKAILASKKLHTAPRAGDGGNRLVLAKDVDSVDTSTLDTDFLSHSYIANHPLLLTDLKSLITMDTPPDKRQFLQARRGGGWRFQPES